MRYSVRGEKITPVAILEHRRKHLLSDIDNIAKSREGHKQDLQDLAEWENEIHVELNEIASALAKLQTQEQMA